MKTTKTKAGRHSRTIVAAASGFSFATLRETSIRAVLGLSVIILVCSWTDRFLQLKNTILRYARGILLFAQHPLVRPPEIRSR